MTKWVGPDRKSMGRVKKFSPPTRDSPACQARWSVGPTRGPKRANPWPVSFTKTNSTCTIFLISLPHRLCAQTPHTLYDWDCGSSSRPYSLRHTHTRFSSPMSLLATTKHASHHVAAGHTRFSSIVTSTTSLAAARIQCSAWRTQSHHRTAIGRRFRPPRPPQRQVCS